MSDPFEGQDLNNLRYGGQVMNMEPTNMSLGEAVTRLFHGEAVHIDLQPGDATRYQLYIIPLWNRILKPGNVSHSDSDDMVVLALLNIDRKTALVRLSPEALDTFYAVENDNEWTRHILASFVSRLANTMQDKFGLRWWERTP